MIEIPKLEIKFTYSAEQRAALMATLPKPLAADVDLDGEFDEFDLVGSAFWSHKQWRHRMFANGSPCKKLKKQRVLLANAFAKAESIVGLEEYTQLCENILAQIDLAVRHQAMFGRKYQAKKDPVRTLLYDAVLAKWERLGGQMNISTRMHGRAKPSGLVIDFMIAALRPIMGDDTPGEEMLKKIVRKRRKARRKSQS
jgi:hypothetical protein